MLFVLKIVFVRNSQNICVIPVEWKNYFRVYRFLLEKKQVLREFKEKTFHYEMETTVDEYS